MAKPDQLVANYKFRADMFVRTEINWHLTYKEEIHLC